MIERTLRLQLTASHLISFIHHMRSGSFFVDQVFLCVFMEAGFQTPDSHFQYDQKIGLTFLTTAIINSCLVPHSDDDMEGDGRAATLSFTAPRGVVWAMLGSIRPWPGSSKDACTVLQRVWMPRPFGGLVP